MSKSEPDDLAKGLSHAVVGIVGAAAIGALLVNFGVRKAGPTYQLVAGAAAIWLHYQMDLPVARKLGELGL